MFGGIPIPGLCLVRRRTTRNHTRNALLILMKPGGRLPMKVLKILLFAAAGCLIAGSLQADIYEWTDETGVKHFTNYAPPDDATMLMKTEEVPYDEAADRARMEADRQFQLELAKLEIAEKEAELARREAEAERRAAEAERYAAETEKAADQYLEDAKNDRYYYRGGGSYGYYRPPYDKRWYYRKYRPTHYYSRPHKRIYRKKSHYGPSKKNYGNKYHQKKQAYPQKYPSAHSLRSPGLSIHSGYRVNSRSRSQMGRSQAGRGSYGRRF
jgi:hypothetical protein